MGRRSTYGERRPRRSRHLAPPPRSAFISRWAIEPRHRNVVEPEVDAEVASMMDDVIEDEAPQDGRLGEAEHRRPVVEQGPHLRELRVGGGLDVLPGLR